MASCKAPTILNKALSHLLYCKCLQFFHTEKLFCCLIRLVTLFCYFHKPDVNLTVYRKKNLVNQPVYNHLQCFIHLLFSSLSSLENLVIIQLSIRLRSIFNYWFLAKWLTQEGSGLCIERKQQQNLKHLNNQQLLGEGEQNIVICQWRADQLFAEAEG